jgi:hypothetical protein
MVASSSGRVPADDPKRDTRSSVGKRPDMKRTRRLVAVAAVAAVVGIPGAASAQGGQPCVGETAQMFKTVFSQMAKSDQGAVGDWLRDVRENPSGFPWCGE